MARIFIVGTSKEAEPVLTFLRQECEISPDELAGLVQFSTGPDTDSYDCSLRVFELDEAADQAEDRDIFIVASQSVDACTAALFSAGVRNVFDGVAMASAPSAQDRLLRAASNFYLGPRSSADAEAEALAFQRYVSPRIDSTRVPAGSLFTVNSVPKAGTIWVAAMLEALLGLEAGGRISVSHLRDIESDWGRSGAYGAVVLVRDMRDVVCSWFHHLRRSDEQNGFEAPRYPTIESFYFEHFIGTIFASERFYFGRLEDWLNFVSARSLPIVRYEDLCADPYSAMRKTLNFWKLDVADELLVGVIKDYSFASMPDKVSVNSNYVTELVGQGHLRRGKPGTWRTEIPDRIANDICARFHEYQERLGYA